MLLESIINETIAYYAANNLALIHKKGLDVSLGSVARKKQSLDVQGRVYQVSTVDYYGLIASRFIAFEAKTTQGKTWSRHQLKPHQEAYLSKVAALGGLSFLIIGFTKLDAYFVLPASKLPPHSTKTLDLAFIQAQGYPLELVFPGRFNLREVILKILSV